jgi:hypothetical protein
MAMARRKERHAQDRRLRAYVCFSSAQDKRPHDVLGAMHQVELGRELVILLDVVLVP